MPGSIINNYGVGDVDLTALMTTVDAQRIGFHSVSLTEWDTSSEPSIAAGSKIEINGALFKFDSDEPIYEDSNLADGTIYIKLTVSGSGEDQVVTAHFTNDVPAWDDEKQGWYESATNNRYLNFAMTLSGVNYSNKYELPKYSEIPTFYQGINTGNITTKTIELEIGDWNMDANPSVGVAHGLTSEQYKNIRAISVIIRDDSDVERYFLVSSDPSVGSGLTFIQISNVNINLYRVASASLFDNANFNATSYNRGWILITYKID